ncbi:MAG: SOS response-associated peptidase family protein, partial [Chloroflexales bacterium]
ENFNVTPTSDIRVIHEDENGQRRLDLMFWGLVPNWAESPAMGSRLINARSETVMEKASFRGPWRHRRALLPALATAGGLAGGGSYNALSESLLWSTQNELLIATGLLGAWLGLRRRAGAAAVVLIWVALLALEGNPWLITYLTPGSGVLLLIWGLRRRRPPPALAGVGLLLINPLSVDLPYLWLITNDVVVISLFMPLAVLAGGAAALLYEALPPVRRWPRASGLVAAALALAVADYGAFAQRDVLNQSTVLATADDRAAIEWAAANTPPAARFLVNTTGWLDAIQRGADGGWWLLPLAGRWTTTPPVLYIYGAPDYVRHVLAVETTLSGFRPGQEQAIFDLIAAEGVTHIYLGAKGGLLKPELFADRPGFRTIYQRGGVTIIAVAR